MTPDNKPAIDTSPEAVERVASECESLIERGWADEAIPPLLRAFSAELQAAREKLRAADALAGRCEIANQYGLIFMPSAAAIAEATTAYRSLP